jgi:NADH-quinone oxidoreductase subunit M
VVAGAASMGLPGFSGFVAELQVLVGAWQAFPSYAVLAGAGIIIGVAYTLRALQKAFFGDAPEKPAEHPLDPITIPERLGALLLLATTVAVGLYPQFLLDLILPAFHPNAPLMGVLTRGGVL